MNTHTKTLVALMGILAGVIIAEVTEYGSEVAVLGLMLGVLQMSIYYFERKKRGRGEGKDTHSENNMRHFSIPLVSGIFCIAVFFIIVRIQFSVEEDTFLCEKACEFRATLATSPKIKDEYQIFSVRPDQVESVHGVYDVQVRVPLYPKYEVGDQVIIFGKVTQPFVAMPHDGKKQFAYDRYLQIHSVGSEMFYPKITKIISSTSAIPLVTRLERFKETCIHIISKYVSEPEASLAVGMLFGVSTMSSELTQTFRVAGISHIVVLSGFNIAILISFILFVFAVVPLFFRVVFASLVVVLFVLMVGGEASIIRATCMSFIGLLALLLGRAYVAKQALLLSLIAIAMYEPNNVLYDVSLHLSFLATAGIVYMSDGIKSMLHKINSVTYKEIMTTTIAAYVVTLPYVMYTFGTVAVYALVTNILVLPLVPVSMLLTFLVVLSAPVSHVLAMILGYVDTLLSSIIIFVARMVEQVPGSSVPITFSYTSMLGMYLLLSVTYTYYMYRQRTKENNETLVTKNDEIWSGVISY